MDRKDLVISSQANLVDYLRHELDVVRAERDRLKERVSLLESVFVGKLRENEKSYRDLEKSFSRIERQVFTAVRIACRTKRRPVIYKEIIKAFFSEYPFLEGKVKIQTIMRRVRKLREKGILVSPQRGFYCPQINNIEKGGGQRK